MAAPMAAAKGGGVRRDTPGETQASPGRGLTAPPAEGEVSGRRERLDPPGELMDPSGERLDLPGELLDLPGELLELILCSGDLGHTDIISVMCTCRRLREVCAARGQVWRRQLGHRWPSMMKHCSHADSVDWLEKYKLRHNAGIEAQRIVSSFCKRFFSERVPCDGFSDIEALDYPAHFFEDELMTILDIESGKCLTLKYYAKKLLYFMRQQAIIRSMKAFLQRPTDQQALLEGAVLIDQYCNPLTDVCLGSVQAQLEAILTSVNAVLRVRNSRHPSLSQQAAAGGAFHIEDVELQGQALDALNHVLFVQLKFKGNEEDYYNSLNSYIHQVLIRKTGIPISLSVLYLTLAERLGVRLEPVNFPSHFLLRWCQGQEGSDISDYVYVDAFGAGRHLTVKECECLIGHHVTEEFYGTVSTKDVMQRMVGNLLNLGKRESRDQCYMLLRDSLDLYLAMYPDNVQHLLLQARLYFHLGIWPEKVLDILQHIQVLDPSQHGAVGYLVQHTLEHIERKKQGYGPKVKLRSEEQEVHYSIGLIMRHKRYHYSCVVYGWDPVCMMGTDWIRNMGVHNLPHGAKQPFYNVLVEDGSCRYGAQENLEHHPAPAEILHPEIGLYFSEFAVTHYLGNEELQIRYPEDTEATVSTIQKIAAGQTVDPQNES
ncbi:F-box only protein 21 isoform X2 [Ascaphus truei]|uniref:F-box only protein 21 isoform X2 n=1 Tax=Ascaphus truei TaxID=8439 RepID=UPI003F5A277D